MSDISSFLQEQGVEPTEVLLEKEREKERLRLEEKGRKEEMKVAR